MASLWISETDRRLYLREMIFLENAKKNHEKYYERFEKVANCLHTFSRNSILLSGIKSRECQYCVRRNVSGVNMSNGYPVIPVSSISNRKDKSSRLHLRVIPHK